MNLCLKTHFSLTNGVGNFLYWKLFFGGAVCQEQGCQILVAYRPRVVRCMYTLCMNTCIEIFHSHIQTYMFIYMYVHSKLLRHYNDDSPSTTLYHPLPSLYHPSTIPLPPDPPSTIPLPSLYHPSTTLYRPLPSLYHPSTIPLPSLHPPYIMLKHL